MCRYPADFYHVLDNEQTEIVGYVTSMWYSPAQQSNIALAFLPLDMADIGTRVKVQLYTCKRANVHSLVLSLSFSLSRSLSLALSLSRYTHACIQVQLPDVYATLPGAPEEAVVVPVPFKAVDSAAQRTGLTDKARAHQVNVVHQPSVHG